MRKQKLVLIIGLVFLVNQLYAQGKFFPMHVGDKYKYNVTYVNTIGISHNQKRFTVEQSTQIAGKTYYYCNGYPESVENYWLRLDSATNYLVYSSQGTSCNGLISNGRIIDSIAPFSGSKILTCDQDYTLMEVSGTQNFFGYNTEILRFRKRYDSHIVAQNWIKTYSSKFGLVKYTNVSAGSGFYGETTYDLVGCYIDGVLYGDTSVVNVELIGSLIPEKHSLSQNYPNPFNPSTKINYEIRSSGFVSLKVFDLLGKEVASLVNEKQNAGSYAVDFNSSEFNLSSGIYFYTLNAGEFKETKKMVLVK